MFGGAREGIREGLRAAAALTGKNDVEAVCRIKSRRAPADDFADRVLDACERLLMYAATPIDDAVDCRRADTRARGHVGDFGSALKQRTFSCANLM